MCTSSICHQTLRSWRCTCLFSTSSSPFQSVGPRNRSILLHPGSLGDLSSSVCHLFGWWTQQEAPIAPRRSMTRIQIVQPLGIQTKYHFTFSFIVRPRTHHQMTRLWAWTPYFSYESVNGFSFELWIFIVFSFFFNIKFKFVFFNIIMFCIKKLVNILVLFVWNYPAKKTPKFLIVLKRPYSKIYTI